MILIFGGVYQGKLAYAMERFGLTQTDVHRCGDDDIAIPENKRAIYEIDRWVLALVRAERDVSEAVAELIAQNENAIVICNDISCGVVPIDPGMRKWREEVGRALGTIARSCDEVIRLFCSIPTRVK